MNNDISVREWMKACPYVQAKNVQRNGSLEYGIFPSRTNYPYRENVLGERIKQERQVLMFIFTAKRMYNSTNADYSFTSNVIRWINEQNDAMNFPSINEGIVKAVAPEVNQYVSEPNRKEERCQIQISLYYQSLN